MRLTIIKQMEPAHYTDEAAPSWARGQIVTHRKCRLLMLGDVQEKSMEVRKSLAFVIRG